MAEHCMGGISPIGTGIGVAIGIGSATGRGTAIAIATARVKSRHCLFISQPQPQPRLFDSTPFRPRRFTHSSPPSSPPEFEPTIFQQRPLLLLGVIIIFCGSTFIYGLWAQTQQRQHKNDASFQFIQKIFTSSLENFRQDRCWISFISIVMHVGPLHLVFNMMVFFQFGSIIQVIHFKWRQIHCSRNRNWHDSHYMKEGRGFELIVFSFSFCLNLRLSFIFFFCGVFQPNLCPSLARTTVTFFASFSVLISIWLFCLSSESNFSVSFTFF